MSLISNQIIMNTTNAPTNLGGENISTNKQIKKLSLLINDSDSDDNILKEGVEGETIDCFSWLNNKFANKDAAYRLSKLKMYREKSQLQFIKKQGSLQRNKHPKYTGCSNCFA